MKFTVSSVALLSSLASTSTNTFANAYPGPPGPPGWGGPGQPGVQNQKVIHPNDNFNKCLGAQSNNNGAPPVIQDCNPNSANQKWIVENNNFKIFGDKTLDDKGGNTTNGAPVQIYTLTGNGNANQMWTYDGYSITLKNTKKCLDNTGGNLNWGNPVRTFSIRHLQ